MTMRGKAAVVGFAELPTLRNYPGRTTTSLLTEACRLAIADAGLCVGKRVVELLHMLGRARRAATANLCQA